MCQLADVSVWELGTSRVSYLCRLLTCWQCPSQTQVNKHSFLCTSAPAGWKEPEESVQAFARSATQDCCGPVIGSACHTAQGPSLMFPPCARPTLLYRDNSPIRDR
ncbi:hypothetical protein EYF80_007487 [Liparis tanakae]|uniref:Uncharacterized protein n=1 Tax=Liparis tanakae TaxID=230148 RepID=A0A4Z2IWW6_9TELE|nr:hypothetical protein EYF80_007487 [Liparis tanakae]